MFTFAIERNLYLNMQSLFVNVFVDNDIDNVV